MLDNRPEVEHLIATQGRLGLLDTSFALLIGVSPSGWCRIRRGERYPSVAAWRRILEALPDEQHRLRALILPVGSSVANSTVPSDNPQELCNVIDETDQTAHYPVEEAA